MIKSFVAMITPFSPGDHPDQGLPGKPPGKPDHGFLPHPEHPIFFPLPPGAPVYPDQGLPGEQPGIDNTLPGQPGRPDQGLPPHPSHPIVLPPGGGGWVPIYIDNTLPGSQPGIDNTLPGSQPRPDNTLPGAQPKPEHPIVLPPPGENPPGKIDWVAGWTPETGWVTVGIVVPEAPVPTPSKKK